MLAQCIWWATIAEAMIRPFSPFDIMRVWCGILCITTREGLNIQTLDYIYQHFFHSAWLRTIYYHPSPGRAFHDEALHRLLGCFAGRFQRLDRYSDRWNTTILRFRALAWAWSRSQIPLSTQKTFVAQSNPNQTSSTHLRTPQRWRIARLEYFVWLHSHGTRLGHLLRRWWPRMLAQGTEWAKIYYRYWLWDQIS